MDKDNKELRQIKLILFALIMSFMTLAVGFLAYSSTIRIENELKNQANNADMYNIGFTTIEGKLIPGNIEAYLLNNDMSNPMPTAENAYLYGTTIRNIRAHFYAPGQYAIYKFYVYNAGRETLYLNDIVFKDIPYTNTRKICEPMNLNTSYESIRDVCDNITLGVLYEKYSINAVYGTVNNIKGVKIKSHKSELVTVIVAYETGAPLATTPIEISFGDIEFRFSIYK